MNLLDKGILDLSGLLDSGEISSEELTNLYIKNIEEKALDKSIYRSLSRSEALEKAKEVDRKRREGRPLGPLAGIPLAVTDDISTKGILSTAGSKVLDNYLPPFNATVVERLLEADAVILGKLRMEEFNLEPSDYATRVVREGGAAYSLGSVKARDNLVSIKPSYGSISRYGVISATSTLESVAIVAKDIGELAMVLNTVLGHDKKDSTSIDMGERDFRQLGARDLKNISLGLAKDLIEEYKGEGRGNLVEDIVRNLEDLNWELEEVTIEGMDYLLPAYKVLSSAEFASNTGRYDGIGFGYRTGEYENREELYKKTRSEAFGKEAQKTIIFGNYVMNSGQYERYYKKSQQIRTLIRDGLDRILKTKDFLVLPMVDSSASQVKEGYSLLARMTGYPSISIPFGRDKEGNPIRLEILSSAFGEDRLVEVGHCIEEYLKDKAIWEVEV